MTKKKPATTKKAAPAASGAKPKASTSQAAARPSAGSARATAKKSGGAGAGKAAEPKAAKKPAAPAATKAKTEAKKPAKTEAKKPAKVEAPAKPAAKVEAPAKPEAKKPAPNGASGGASGASKRAPKPVVKWSDRYRENAPGPWTCKKCGSLPLRLQPLYGEDERHHCPNVDCDEVVTLLTQEELEPAEKPRSWPPQRNKSKIGAGAPPADAD